MGKGVVNRLIEEWQEFYLRFYRIKLDLFEIVIPEYKRGYSRLIMIAQDITPQRAFDCVSIQFSCHNRTEKSLDETIDFSFQTRNAQNGSYAIWIRDRVEVDKNLKGLPANDLVRMNSPQIQLEERIIYELKFWDETGMHLDREGDTLCAGSRYRNGNVPIVYCDRDGFCVNWQRSSWPNQRTGSRQIVS